MGYPNHRELGRKYANVRFTRERILELAEAYADHCPTNANGMALSWLRRARLGTADWYMAVGLAEACEEAGLDV